MATLVLPPEVAEIEDQVQGLFKELFQGFQKLDKIKDVQKQKKQLEEFTGKMREAKRLIKDFGQGAKGEAKDDPELSRLVTEKKHALVRELNTFIALRKTFTNSLGAKSDLLEGGSEAGTTAMDGSRMASTMSNQELILAGRKQMDETDKTIQRSKKVVEDTMHIGTETAATLKAQTEQLGRIVNDLDTIQFSIKKATQLVREIGKQMATDKCIMGFLFLVVGGIVAVIVVKIVQQQKSKSSSSTTSTTSTNSTNSTSRRLLSFLLDT